MPNETPSSNATPSAVGPPWGLFVLLALGGVIYVIMLHNAAGQEAGGGEASMEQAFEALFLTLGEWLVLAFIMANACLLGPVPRWMKALSLVLVPAAALATFTGIDMISRHMPWAIVFPAALPAVIAFYALWARLPRLQQKLAAERTSALVAAALFGLSVIAFAAAA
jgi:hypothetical protein